MRWNSTARKAPRNSSNSRSANEHGTGIRFPGPIGTWKFVPLAQQHTEVMETLEGDSETLANASTQELANELFSREDWEEATFPNGTHVDRGAYMTMNTAEEVDKDGYKEKVWPVIDLSGVELEDALRFASEGYWRKHVNAFRQEENVDLAEKHREEHTIEWRFAEIGGEEQECRVVEVHAPSAGDIDSVEQQKLEAKSTLQQLIDSGKITREEALEMLQDE